MRLVITLTKENNMSQAQLLLGSARSYIALAKVVPSPLGIVYLMAAKKCVKLYKKLDKDLKDEKVETYLKLVS